ncbi:polyhydroxyalkanoate depolymerase [Stappia sp.]|uniref:polyhydroxyalkanoate depolymerase n=1 Tax=Stappia sp. TaxID=1870903 RepID=UPI0035B564D8
MSPIRAGADMTRLYFQNPLNPLSHTPAGRQVAAGCELIERMTRRYGKPEFGLDQTTVSGVKVPVREEVVWSKPFCNLLHFDRKTGPRRRNDPRILIVAPMSGHYATLLRGTVETLLPSADIYITDWVDARMVPVTEGRFDLDDYIDYIIEMLHFLGPDTHLMAVCQPSVPALAAVAVMEAHGDPMAPASMTLMGGPIDTRINPTAVNDLAENKGIEWFERNVIMKVPFPQPGFMRDVYPGFLQLSGFMSMNLDRHMNAHHEFFNHLVAGDGDSAEKHREFYDEYLAVMDLAAEFYLQTVETVFIKHALPKGEFRHRGETVDCGAIRRTALLTVEGEKDDITGRGQTKAAHDLCVNLSPDMQAHYMQPDVGHYGVFNGSRFRSEIAPRILDFIRTHYKRPETAPAAPKAPVPVKDAVKRETSEPVARPAATQDKAAAKAETASPRAGDPLATVLLAEPQGAADDLTAITGVGPKLQTALNGAGIFHFWQIAALTDAQIEALDGKLDFKGRIAREGWIEQARKLAAAQPAEG